MTDIPEPSTLQGQVEYWRERAKLAEWNLLQAKIQEASQDREIAELKERVKVLQGEMGS